jgi:hypothetical protein
MPGQSNQPFVARTCTIARVAHRKVAICTTALGQRLADVANDIIFAFALALTESLSGGIGQPLGGLGDRLLLELDRHGEGASM